MSFQLFIVYSYLKRYPNFSFGNRNRKSGRDPPIGTKRTAIGSNEKVSVAYYDAGLLSTVLDAYNEHFILRTGKLRPFN